MSSRPLERLPTIRGKLGATIVVAVAITILISYALIGFALRNSPRDSEAIDALSLARRIASGEVADPAARHDGRAAHRRPARSSVEGVNLGVLPPDTPGRVPRWGVLGNNVWASIPTDEGGSLIVLYPSPTPGIPGPHLGDPRLPAERVVAVPAGRRDRGRDRVGHGPLARPRHDPAAA